jgi:DNA-nicking Smr family endonuclease
VKKPQGPGGHKKGRSSPDDDHAIWQYAASSIEPLKRKGRFHPASEAVKAGVPKPKTAGAVAAQKRTEDKHHASSVHSAPAPPKPVVATAPDLALFDRNSARKIRGGRLVIEARVDLHGMRQHEAHAALKRFIFSCQSRGFRYVLIITGKGKALGSAASRAGEEERERGVLKRNVPRWLEEPDLRAVIVSFTTAAIQHGGEGAIYVHLRSKSRG